MLKSITMLSALAVVGAANATIITQWNFNSAVADANTATGTTNPNIGTGTAALVGGVTATFASGDASGGSTDPATGDDSGWNLTTFAAQNTGSGTRGAQFNVSTVGFADVVLTMDNRHSNTSSKWLQVQYTLDGNAWSSTGLADDGQFSATAGDTWFNSRSVDFSGVLGAANNANFGVRVVAIFDPLLGNAYSASNPTSAYGTTSTLRFDMVTVSGNAVPEPASMAILGVGFMGLIARRRRSTK